MPADKRRPTWLPRLAEAVAGEHLNDRNVFEPNEANADAVIRGIREELSLLPDSDWITWGRWFLADRSTRTISPFSKTTTPDYIQRRIKENTVKSLDEAERLALGDPHFLEQIAAARRSLPPDKTDK